MASKVEQKNKLLLSEFKNKYNKEFICKRPFELIELDTDGNLYLCFPRCDDKSYQIGNLYEATFEELATGQKAKEFKKSVLEANYTFCDFHNCQAPDIDLNIENINSEELYGVIYPKELRLHIDNICNINCFMCANTTNSKHPDGKLFRELIIPRILSMCKSAEKIFMNGNGEVLFSPLAKELIQKITKKYPEIKFDLCTNGLNCTKEKIQEYNLENKITNISLSMHAATKNTYEKIIQGSNFDKIIKNIKWLKEEYDKGAIDSINLNFVVSKYNYKEMVDFQLLANNLGFGTFFSMCQNNQALSERVNYDRIAVFNKKHREYKKFCKILKNKIFKTSNCIFDNNLSTILDEIESENNNILQKFVMLFNKK